MFTFKIKIAEKVIKITSFFEETKAFCEGYISDASAVEDIIVEMKREYINAEKEYAAANNLQPGLWMDNYFEILALYRKIIEGLTDFNIMMFHGSALAVDGEAYIFTAHSGTGKSTHTRLWREYLGDRVVMVNDDKPLVSFKDGRAYVHGTPWNGKHNIGANLSVPVKAICILERDLTNHIEPVDMREAFPTFYTQTYRSKNPKVLTKTLPMIDMLSKSVKLYKLGCNMDIEAAKIAYEGMKN